MDRKIFGIFVFMLLIILTLIPGFKSDFNVNSSTISNNSNTDELIIKQNSIKPIVRNQLYNNNLEKKCNSRSLYNDYFCKYSNSFINDKKDFFNNPINSNVNNLISNDIFRDQNIINFNKEFFIKGYVSDETSHSPISEAQIIILWRGDRYSYDRVFTNSNVDGFYSLNFGLNVIWSDIQLVVRASGYYSEILFIQNDLIYTDNNGNLWFNVSLAFGSHPENTLISGYLTDIETGEPIVDAVVDFEWQDKKLHTDWNYTRTDSLGFFIINSAPGEAYLWVYSDKYCWDIWHYNSITIYENEKTKSVNIRYLSRHEENSKITGVITDESTGKPIGNAVVVIYWLTNPLIFDMDWTLTDSSGRYEIDVPAGPVSFLMFDANEYSRYEILYYDGEIEEHKTVNIDMALHPIPDISEIYGFVTDEITGDPVPNAEIWINWQDDQMRSNSNKTYSDSSGFYKASVPAGEISLGIIAEDYLPEYYSYNYIIINEYETKNVDISIKPFPVENSIVCGYIKDKNTGDAIENAWVGYIWNDDQYHSYQFSTLTDSSGFYSITGAAGDIYIQIHANLYSGVSGDYIIGEYETLWLNATLTPRIENSVFHGYITNSENQEPIKYATIIVNIYYQDTYYFNYSMSNREGYYNINVPAGEIELEFYCYGFNPEKTVYTIEENETYNLNILLEQFIIQLIKPQNGIYYNNNKILPFLKPIIVGNIDIEVEEQDLEYNEHTRVLFFIDNKLKYEDDNYRKPPYNWTWDEKTFGRYKLKIIALQDSFLWSSIASKEITVWKFF